MIFKKLRFFIEHPLVPNLEVNQEVAKLGRKRARGKFPWKNNKVNRHSEGFQEKYIYIELRRASRALF